MLEFHFGSTVNFYNTITYSYSDLLPPFFIEKLPDSGLAMRTKGHYIGFFVVSD